MRIVGPLVCIALIVPVAASQSGLILGTEELPELPPSGPPTYGTIHSGPRDHDYLQILAGWFSYDDATDEIVWNLKVADGSGYKSPPTDWRMECGMSAVLTTNGDRTGGIHYTWRKTTNGSESSSVTFREEAGARVGVTEEQNVAHRTAVRFDAPAYFEFRIDRNVLAGLGDQIEQFTGDCTERYEPHVAAGVLPAEHFTNSASSSSDAVYSFQELRRLRGPDGALDPIEEFERNNTTAQPSSDTTAPSNGSPSVGAVAMLLVTVAAAFLVGRRRRIRKPE